MKDQPENHLPLKNFLPHKPSAIPASSEDQDETITGIVVRQASDDACHHGSRPVITPKTNNALTSESMLGVVSYCYAKGVYSSAEIEQLLLTDPAVRNCCGNDVPDAKTIRSFRKFNRENILAVLDKLFSFRRHQEKALPQDPPPATPGSAPKATRPEEPDETTIVYAHKQSLDRLDNAIIIDQTLDDE